MNDTPTIRARIHESAIKRVTRMFAATLADAFTLCGIASQPAP